MSSTAIANPKLSTADLAQGHLYMEQTRQTILGATQGLSDAQWTFKPSPDRWSAAEILEHVVIVQELVARRILEQLALAPAPGERDNPQVESIILGVFPLRLAKFPAPEFSHPSGRVTPPEALRRFEQNCAELAVMLESRTDLRDHVLEAAPLKAVSKGKYETMDGYQWLLAVAAHTERHAKQILELRVDPDFPSEE